MDTPAVQLPTHLAALVPPVVGLAFVVRGWLPAIDGRARVLALLVLLSALACFIIGPEAVKAAPFLYLRDVALLTAGCMGAVATADRLADRMGTAAAPDLSATVAAISKVAELVPAPVTTRQVLTIDGAKLNVGAVAAQLVDEEELAKILHEAGRAAVEAGAVLNPGQKFVEWADLPEAARDGRRMQVRELRKVAVLAKA